MSDPVVVSCPGKVLLAGGYLVLDRNHQGFVISTPSRFYTVVQEQSDSNDQATEQANEGQERVKLSVRSPQFDDGLWEYQAIKEDGAWIVKESDTQGSSNSFVHLSLQATLQIATALSPSAKIGDLFITIVGSNDFYSQSREDETPIAFAPLNCTIRNVHKTGLGSSAAMVTSLTSALFLHWTSSPDSTPSDPSPETTQLMHNLAQYVHSLAQGKIGSGFDVSAAVHGSQVYKRFDVKCLGTLLETGDDKKTSSQSLLSVLSPSHNPSWTSPSSCASVTPFCLPPHMTLLLADVDAGSNTPSMVGKVLAWKKASPVESDRVWNELSKSNEELAKVFGMLKEEYKDNREAYKKEVEKLSKVSSKEWSSSSFSLAASAILSTRSLMRTMGESSSVPIEPPSQTKLLDACTNEIPGVVGAGVPGAGGYDAIWVLCLTPPSSSSSDPTPLENVERLLRGWTQMSVRPLSRNAWVRGGSEEGERGLKRVRLGDVEGLAGAVERAEGMSRR
ncbi:hypothetical protein JCM5353_008200 [Sporobolomyces roseus]